MRFVGFALLVAGFLLCLSIAWAAIGFFSMAFGLIFLLVAEHQRKNANYLDLTRLDSSLPIASPTKTEFVDRRNELTLERDHVPQTENSWESLVASDEELSQAVNLLSPLGRQYVDQLAKMYLAYQNKAYLPVILKMILEAAQADADLLDLSGSVAGAPPRSPIEKQLSHLPKTPENDVSYKAISEAYDPIDGNPSGPHDAVFASVPPLSNDGVDDNLRDLLRRLDLTPGNRR